MKLSFGGLNAQELDASSGGGASAQSAVAQVQTVSSSTTVSSLMDTYLRSR